MNRREFTVADQHQYSQAGPMRWIASHLLRYKRLLAVFVVSTLSASLLNATMPLLIGNAFSAVLHGATPRTTLAQIALTMLALVVGVFACDAAARSTIEFLGKRLSRDAADELYASLLGKSQL